MRRIAPIVLLIATTGMSSRWSAAGDAPPAPAPLPVPVPVAPVLPVPAPSAPVQPPEKPDFVPPLRMPDPDVLAQVLADAKFPIDDLGFRPLGTWNRYPTNVPFKLPFFDDLLAHPLDTYEFTRTLGNAVEDLLTPESLSNPPEDGRPESLYRLVLALGTDRRIGGFRGFGVGLLDEKVDEKDPLGDALRRLIELAWGDDTEGVHVEVDDRAETKAAIRKYYGMDADTPSKSTSFRVPDLDRLPETLRAPLARLLVELAASIRWVERGLRNVPAATRDRVRASLPTLVASTPDAAAYFPAVEDAANAIDHLSLAYGSLKALAAVQRARREIDAVRPKDGWDKFVDFVAPTPWGQVVIESRGGGNSQGLYSRAAPLLFVATGEVDVVGQLAASDRYRPVSVALFMDEVHTLLSKTFDEPGPATNLGSGVLGCGILYSAGAHSTLYDATQWGLGAGLFGVGVLVDEGGNDTYRVHDVGEGAAMFGAGILLDAAGDDRYLLLGGDGQGFGGPGGVGVLADRSGNDHYYAEPLPEKAGGDCADYHSDQKIVSSNAQGSGMGRRGDMNDGHAWAGGLGVLIDVDGDDVYEAGNFSQGVGYWFGTGLLYDGGGNDIYRSVYFSHGSGAHFAVGAVIDESGDDQHLLVDWPGKGLGKAKPGAGIGFGWDVVNALVIDRAGNDRYEAGIISEGVAEVRSMGFLFDEEGDDVYVADEGAQAFGDIDEAPAYSTPNRGAAFAFHLPQVGMCLDLGGHDQYLRRAADGHLVPDAKAGDGKSWGREGAHGSLASGAGRNLAIGRDVAHGRLGFLDAWPRRVPHPPAAAAAPSGTTGPSSGSGGVPTPVAPAAPPTDSKAPVASPVPSTSEPAMK